MHLPRFFTALAAFEDELELVSDVINEDTGWLNNLDGRRVSIEYAKRPAGKVVYLLSQRECYSDYEPNVSLNFVLADAAKA